MLREGWWNWPGWPLPEEWSAWWDGWMALAAIATAVAAVGALLIARQQLGQLIQSNRDLQAANRQAAEASIAQIRPYVAVDLEMRRAEFRRQGGVLQGGLRLVISNMGMSPAVNVRLTATPPFEPSAHAYRDEVGRAEGRKILAKIFSGDIAFPVIQPARRFLYYFDNLPGVFQDTTTPRSYALHLEYDSVDGHKFTDDYTLDVDILGPSILEPDMMRRLSKDLEAVSYSIDNVKNAMPRASWFENRSRRTKFPPRSVRLRWGRR